MNYPHFVGLNDKFINLNSIALIEDKSDENGESMATITTNEGNEFDLVGTDADIVFERIERFAVTTDDLLERLASLAA